MQTTYAHAKRRFAETDEIANRSYAPSVERAPMALLFFLGFAAGCLLVLGAAACIGFLVDGQQWFRVHFALGLFGSLLAFVVHIGAFMYLSVTGKAMRQAVALAHLDESMLADTRRLKKRLGRVMSAGLILLVATAALGAATSSTPSLRAFHMLAALTAVAGNAVAFWHEAQLMRSNDALLGTVMCAYRRLGPHTAPSTTGPEH